MARGYCLQMWTQMGTKTDLWIIYGHKTDLKTTGLDVRNKCIIDPLIVCALGWISACSSFFLLEKVFILRSRKSLQKCKPNCAKGSATSFNRCRFQVAPIKAEKQKGWNGQMVICASYFIVPKTDKLVDAGK